MAIKWLPIFWRNIIEMDTIKLFIALVHLGPCKKDPLFIVPKLFGGYFENIDAFVMPAFSFRKNKVQREFFVIEFYEFV